MQWSKASTGLGCGTAILIFRGVLVLFLGECVAGRGCTWRSMLSNVRIERGTSILLLLLHVRGLDEALE